MFSFEESELTFCLTDEVQQESFPLEAKAQPRNHGLQHRLLCFIISSTAQVAAQRSATSSGKPSPAGSPESDEQEDPEAIQVAPSCLPPNDEENPCLCLTLCIALTASYLSASASDHATRNTNNAIPCPDVACVNLSGPAQSGSKASILGPW